MKQHSTFLLIAMSALAIDGCAQTPAADPPPRAMPAQATGSNSLTPAERASGWRLLFDGTSMDAWRGYKSPDVPAGWKVADGAISKASPVPDIISREQFGNFDLQIEWKIGEAGNSGIFYRGSEEFERIYWTAPEYQLLDDIKARDGRSRLTSTGAAYGLYPSPAGHLVPVGQWNLTRIVARGAHVEHWLNGTKLLEYEAQSPDWEGKVAASKFNEWPKYGRLKSGHLALQGDHAGSLAFRAIKIRALD